MSDIDDFGAWIVKNQALKGTPDFETVAKAFKEVYIPPAPSNIDDVYEALRKADAAGNVDDVRTLVKYLETLRAPPAPSNIDDIHSAIINAGNAGDGEAVRTLAKYLETLHVPPAPNKNQNTGLGGDLATDIKRGLPNLPGQTATTTQTTLATPQPLFDTKAEGTDMFVSAIPLFILAAIFFSPARYGRLVERLAVVIVFALSIVNILVMSKTSLGIGDESALFAGKIARMLPWTILIYGVVAAWVMYFNKNDKTIDYVFLWHACGVIVTAVVAAMFNEVSIHWIFSGSPINSFGEFIDKQPPLYTLYHALVPAAVTVIYVKWLKNRDPSITIEQSYTHVKCPDCRELVLRDARKCKHCGCGLIPQ